MIKRKSGERVGERGGGGQGVKRRKRKAMGCADGAKFGKRAGSHGIVVLENISDSDECRLEL